MQYYVDAYNLLFRKGKGSGSSLQSQREKVVQELNQKAQRFHLDMTLVFDAMHQPEQSRRYHYQSLEIVFTSRKQSADQYLLHVVEESSRPSEITIVSSDRDLTWKAKLLGAETVSIEGFLQQLEEPRKRHRQIRSRKKPDNVFNRELKKLEKTSESKPEPEPPKPKKQKPSGEIAAYLEVFETRFQELESPETPEEPTPPAPSAPPAVQETEEQRWMRLFERRLQDKSDG